MFKKPLPVLTVAISSRLLPLNQSKSSVLPFGAAYVEDAELVRVGQNMGSTAAMVCTMARFSLPAGQAIQITQLQTAQQTAYERTTLFNNSANEATIVTPTAAATQVQVFKIPAFLRRFRF